MDEQEEETIDGKNEDGISEDEDVDVQEQTRELESDLLEDDILERQEADKGKAVAEGFEESVEG